jgi:hypothetical protein
MTFRTYIYDLIDLMQDSLGKQRHGVDYYPKPIVNTTRTDGVFIDHDLIAKLKARQSENVNDVIVSNTQITITQIHKLREHKNLLLKNKSTIKLKEFKYITELLNIRI